MFKQIRFYFVIVSLPFVLLLGGSAYFFSAIRKTILSNPHPQINYTIFYIILFGGSLILLSAYRLLHEARTIREYSEAIRSKYDLASLQALVGTYTGDISYVLQMLVATGGRSISHQEQVAIEHELTNARSRLYRRNALPQYLSGLLVGMGLLGTFVGLLSTLSDIAILINSFADLDMATASPLLVFRTMIERMKAPMQSMSIAFSASMFGLLGSIILGLMMLGIRRLQGDIISKLGSEVARHVEIALSYESFGSESGGGGEKSSGTVIYNGGEDAKTLLRIEERLAESGRVQQRMLAAEIEDFQQQRADMLRVITELNETNIRFRGDLQQLCRQFGDVLSVLDKGNGILSQQISEQTVNVAADAKETHKLLVMQMDEQKRLRDSIDSCKIEERLVESSRTQQRMLAAEIDDFNKQRAAMISSLVEQTEANNNFRAELQQLGRRLDTAFAGLEKDNSEIYNQITELLVHSSADAKESHKLLTMQISEQKLLRETLDWRTNNR